MANNNRPKTYVNFALVLYPESEQHQRILSYLERRRETFRPVYILHDRDVWVEGDELPEGAKIGDRKKPHWHVSISYPCQTTASAVSKFLGGVYVEGLNNPASYLFYMIHDTPESWLKERYEASELHGDMAKIKKVFGKNAYFVQLKDIANDIANGDSLIDIVQDVSEADEYVFMETFKKFGGLITAMANQFDRRSVVKCSRTKKEAELRAVKDLTYYSPLDIQIMRETVRKYSEEYGY